MTNESVVECTFYIPQRRDAVLSDGEPHDPRMWIWLRDEVYRLFHGATTAPGWYQGLWQDPETKKKVSDKSRKYFVAVPRSQVNRLREFLARACKQFQQKAIYLSVGGKVEFIGANDRETNGNLL